MAHDVFVSYSHKDKVVADAIVSYLEFKGSRCWYAPRDIVPGADWAASIMDAIRSAKVMVLLFTDYANTSTQVAREVNLAVSNGVTIIPFKMTNSMPTQGMQYYLSTVHWLDAMSSPLDQSIKK
ncbi:MAG: toll/interleukin-1 receptor domain-containing protein, partial [Atopobiaceae bacterium]|nr:toll/interleukin-1 receptor domain-containing protein [Atopobiaceae bacterium]